MHKNIRDLQQRNDRLVALLKEVRERCLYPEDNGEIGVTTEPHIDEDLFQRICKEVKGV